MSTRNDRHRNHPNPPKPTRTAGRALGLEHLEERTLLAVFTVHNPLDTAAPGSLRWAVGQANATAGHDTITFEFDAPGGVTIPIDAALPAIEVGDDVDVVAPPAAGGGEPLVRLDGGMNAEYGLSLTGSRAAVRGLGFANFLTAAVRVEGPQNTIGGTGPADRNVLSGNMYGVWVEPSAHGTAVVGNVLTANQLSSVHVNGFTVDANGASTRTIVRGVVVARNLFGFAADGVSPVGNFNHAVAVEGTAPGSLVRVDDNTVGGSLADGIRVENASGVRIAGNRVGVDAAGGRTGRTINTGNGIAVTGGSSDVTIGGAAPGEGNLIAGNFGNGVRVEDSSLVTVAGNTISHNHDDGVGLVGASQTLVTDNAITHNAGSGVGAYGRPSDDDAPPPAGNEITGNSIRDNGGLGIDLVTTRAFGTATIPVFGPTPGAPAYGYPAFPTIDAADVRSTGAVVRGTLPGAVAGRTYVIHVYANAAVDPGDVWDGVQFGEGEQLVGTISVTADADGPLSFRRFFAGAVAGTWFTATATDAQGNTSEFSPAVPGVAAPDPIVTTTITSSLNPSVIGLPVTFTARVTLDGAAPPWGVVHFMDGDTLLSEGPVDAAGNATVTTHTLTIGAHAITAAYVEFDGALPAAADALIQGVTKASTRTALAAASAGPPGGSTAGQPVTLTATVTVRDSPLPAGGAVTFFDGDAPIGSAALVDGVASLTTSSLSAGHHAITAVYGGTPTHFGSASDAVDHTVSGGGETVVRTGDTATIGFWRNKNGQALIKSLNGSPNSKLLASWLSATFPNLYGRSSPHNLVGKTNVDVAALFTRLFNSGGQKLDAQVLGVALAVYSTTASLGGAAAVKHGFTVDAAGAGQRLFSVGDGGAAFGVPDGTTLRVRDLLAAADARAVNGALYGGNAGLRNMANGVFSGINEQGDIV